MTTSRIQEKIREIEGYLDYLMEITPPTVEEYTRDKLIKAACERYFEKIMEAVTDVAYLAIIQKKWSIPEDDTDAFRILEEKQAISKELYAHIKNAKGMRNFLAHQYGKVDDERVHEAITEELETDIQKFISELQKVFKPKKTE